MQFETFDKSFTPFTGEPHITIQRRGTITINAAAFAALESPEAVELLYDRDNDVLGLRSVPANVAHSAYVRRSTKAPGGPWVISAMAFVHHYEIDTSTARRWVAELDGDVLLARLSGDHLVVSKSVNNKDASKSVKQVEDEPDEPEADSRNRRSRPRPFRS